MSKIKLEKLLNKSVNTVKIFLRFSIIIPIAQRNRLNDPSSNCGNYKTKAVNRQIFLCVDDRKIRILKWTNQTPWLSIKTFNRIVANQSRTEEESPAWL
jgi:hypothetical protein